MKNKIVPPVVRTAVSEISRAINRLSLFALVLMMLLTVADVLMRKIFSNSLLGTVEITEMMMLILIYLALARTEEINGNVKVELFVSRLSRRSQATFDVFTQLVGWLLLITATVSCLVYAENMRLSGEVSQDLGIPIWPFVYVIAFGVFMLSISLLIKFLDAIDEAIRHG